MERRTGASSPRRTPSALVASRIQELERPQSQPSAVTSAVPRHHRSHSALEGATCLVRTSSSLSGPRPQPVYQLDARPELQPRYDPRLDARLDPRLDSGHDPRYDPRYDYDPRHTSERAEVPPTVSVPITSTSTNSSTSTSTATDPKPSIAMTIVAKVLPWMPASPTSFISGLLTGLTIAYLRPTLEVYLDLWAQYCATGLRLVIVWGSVAAVAIAVIKIMQRTGAAAQAISSSPPQVKKKKDASVGYEDSEVPRIDRLSSPAVAPVAPAPPPAPSMTMPRASSPTASPQSWQLPGAFRASPEPYYVHTSHGNLHHNHHNHNHHHGHDLGGRGSALSTRSAGSTRSDGSIVSYASCASDGSYETAYSQPAYVHTHHPRSHSHSHTPRPGTTAAAVSSATRQASPVRRKISPPDVEVSVLEKPANSAAFRLKAK